MMKRIISMVLVLVMLVAVASVTVFARENNNKADKEYLYEHLIPKTPFSYYYDELYYHYVDENDPDSEIDWAIVYCDVYLGSPGSTAVIVSDRVIQKDSIGDPYTVYYAIYDAQLDELISIELVDPAKYKDFDKVLEETKIGNPFGDADYDYRLTIMDATYIQRVMAQLCEFKEKDVIVGEFGGIGREYISDIDRDGERTILDATAIQLKLAEVE